MRQRKVAGDRERAIELLKTTNLKYKEIANITGVPLGTINGLALTYRPAEVRNANRRKAGTENLMSVREVRGFQSGNPIVIQVEDKPKEKEDAPVQAASPSSTSRDYALLLLAKTRLTYSQISDLTGISINKIGAWAQEHRSKEARDENVLNGMKPDIQEELIRLKQEMEQHVTAQEILESEDIHELQEEFPEAVVEEPAPVEEQDIIRHSTFKYSVETSRPINKALALEELERISARIMNMGADEFQLYITIEGV